MSADRRRLCSPTVDVLLIELLAKNFLGEFGFTGLVIMTVERML